MGIWNSATSGALRNCDACAVYPFYGSMLTEERLALLVEA